MPGIVSGVLGAGGSIGGIVGGLIAKGNARKGPPPLGTLGASTPSFRLRGRDLETGAPTFDLSRLNTPELRRRTERRGRIFGDIDVLRAGVAPGFGKFTESAVQTVKNARARALGNLRDQLSRRKVSGSSFASDTLTRAEAEFAQLEQQERAKGFLAEFGATVDLLNQEAGLLSNEVQEELQGLQIATGLAASITQGIQRSSDFRAQLAAEEARGRGEFFGRLGGDIGSLVGSFGGDNFSSLFGSGQTGEQLFGLGSTSFGGPR